MDPIAQYEFVFDEGYLIEAFQRYRDQRIVRRVFLVIKTIGALVLLFAAVGATVNRQWGMAAFLAASVLFIVNAHRVDYWLVKRRFRKSPYKNENMTTTLTPDGCRFVTSKSDSEVKWAAFTKVRRFRDGFLFFQGPQYFNWLPDAGLVDGSLSGIESLIMDRASDFSRVGPTQAMARDRRVVDSPQSNPYRPPEEC